MWELAFALNFHLLLLAPSSIAADSGGRRHFLHSLPYSLELLESGRTQTGNARSIIWPQSIRCDFQRANCAQTQALSSPELCETGQEAGQRDSRGSSGAIEGRDKFGCVWFGSEQARASVSRAAAQVCPFDSQQTWQREQNQTSRTRSFAGERWRMSI